MEYKHFYIAIRRYVKGRISREMFLLDWKYAQSRQGIEIEEYRGKQHGRKNK